MKSLNAAMEAAKQTAAGRKRVENNFIKDLKNKVLFIGENKDFGSYLESKGIQVYEHEVNGEDGAFVLFHAKDKNGELITAHMFEWQADFNNGVMKIEIKGNALDIPTAELDRLLKQLEEDEEEKECDCPACQLRRMLHKH